MVRRFAFTAFLLLAAHAAAAQSLQPAPTAPPPASAPHPINAPPPADPALVQKLELLRERIGQRDQLQREIDQLIVETQTPQRMVVHFELLEVNYTAAVKLGLMPTGTRLDGALSNRPVWTLADLEKLRQEGAVQALISPSIEVSSGEQAASHFGGAHANTDQNGVDSPFTELRVRADSLGNNQVQVDFRIDRATPPEGKKTSSGPIPQTQRTMVDSRLTSSFGETQLLGGAITERTRTRRGALGRATETIMIETVLLIRVDAEMPQTAGVVPAAAIAPR
jgi:hypothetical protein